MLHEMDLLLEAFPYIKENSFLKNKYVVSDPRYNPLYVTNQPLSELADVCLLTIKSILLTQGKRPGGPHPQTGRTPIRR